MNKCFLITRPEHDDTTHYLSKWGEKTIGFAACRGVKVLDLFRKKADKENVESYIKKNDPSLIVFNGHGNNDVVAGDENKAVIKAGENEALLKSRIVYAISCRSAKELGPKSIKAGAKAYLGYDDDFIFVYNPGRITNPLNDATAGLFLNSSNELITSLIKGNSAGEAYERSQKHFKENIGKLLTSESSKDAGILVRYLWWDCKHQVCLGEKESVFC